MNRRYFKVLKEHQFSNDVSIYYAVMNQLYVVVVEDENDIPKATYSSFDSLLARQKYRMWYNILAKNKGEIEGNEDNLS